MAGTSRGLEPLGSINVTPLVDIMLVLLVIFIVTARVTMHPAVKVDLPRAARVSGVRPVLAIEVPAGGGILVDGVPLVDDEAFVRRARTELARDPELRAVIHGDGQARHADVLRALDLLGRAGIERVAFAALPAAEAR